MDNLEFLKNSNLKSSAGVFIDIDGVVLKGGKPFEWSYEAVHKLWDHQVPFVFLTNGTYTIATLAASLSEIFDLPITVDHCIVAPSPCIMLTEYHKKRVLVVCQEDSENLIAELGFTNYMTVPQLVEVFPELDFVDHKRRKNLLKNPMSSTEKLNKFDAFKPIEAILLLGEPINWECHLQILIDVLMTDGDPRNSFKFVPSEHLPIIASNKDLTFKGSAELPRFGHGAFLECLETLYEKITKNELIYEHMLGKPLVVTFEFAANRVQKFAREGHIVDKFYMIGDNPDVDIKGGNNFKKHLHDYFNPAQLRSGRKRRTSITDILEVEKKTGFKRVESVLVCTGVYNPQSDLQFHLRNLFNLNDDMGMVNLNLSDGEDDADCSADEYLEIPKVKRTNSSASMLLRKLKASAPMSRCESTVSLYGKVNKSNLAKNELQAALSHKNSFINYFEDKMNVPDITVFTLLDAVEYICQSNELYSKPVPK